MSLSAPPPQPQERGASGRADNPGGYFGAVFIPSLRIRTLEAGGGHGVSPPLPSSSSSSSFPLSLPITINFSTMGSGGYFGLRSHPAAFGVCGSAVRLWQPGGGQNLRTPPPPDPPPHSITGEHCRGRGGRRRCSTAALSSWLSLGFIRCPHWGGGPHPKGVLHSTPLDPH